jgi:Ca2+-dependent lipid-binding protein
MMIYPNKYHIPIVLEKDVKSVSTRIPVGILKLTVVSANGLKPGDFTTCDPYVQFTVHGSEYKTPVVKNTQAPVWSVLLLSFSLSLLTFSGQERNLPRHDLRQGD